MKTQLTITAIALLIAAIIYTNHRITIADETNYEAICAPIGEEVVSMLKLKKTGMKQKQLIAIMLASTDTKIETITAFTNTIYTIPNKHITNAYLELAQKKSIEGCVNEAIRIDSI